MKDPWGLRSNVGWKWTIIVVAMGIPFLFHEGSVGVEEQCWLSVDYDSRVDGCSIPVS